MSDTVIQWPIRPEGRRIRRNEKFMLVVTRRDGSTQVIGRGWTARQCVTLIRAYRSLLPDRPDGPSRPVSIEAHPEWMAEFFEPPAADDAEPCD